MIEDVLIGAFLACVFWLIAGIFILFGQTHQGWIAFDQWFHCLCYEDAMADETFSARCWREYKFAEPMIDVFKWGKRVQWLDRVFGEGHCQKSFESERCRTQLPKEYR